MENSNFSNLKFLNNQNFHGIIIKSNTRLNIKLKLKEIFSKV